VGLETIFGQMRNPTSNKCGGFYLITFAYEFCNSINIGVKMKRLLILTAIIMIMVAASTSGGDYPIRFGLDGVF